MANLNLMKSKSLADLELQPMFRSMTFRLLLVIIIGSLASASTIGLMGLSAWLISSAALQPPLYVLSLAIVGVRCCGISRAVFRYLERYLLHLVGFELFTKFRVIILRKIIQALPFERQCKNGDVFNIIINAVDSLRDSFLRFFLPPLTTAVITLVTAFWLSFYSYILVGILILSWLIFSIIMPIICLKAYNQITPCQFSLSQDIMDFYRGNIELQTYNYQTAKLQTSKHSIEEYQQYRTQLFHLKCKISACSEALSGIFIVILFTMVIYLVNNHTFNAVMAITILLTMQALYDILNALPSLSEHLYESQQHINSLQPFLKPPKTLATPSNSITQANNFSPVVLKAENLSFGYDKVLCHNINFELHAKERTLLIGSSGCGKSTLFYILTKLLNPMQGKVFLQGKDYASLTAKDIAENLSVSFQDHHLFQQSIRDNFKMLYPDITDEEIINALNKVALSDLINLHGLDYLLHKDGNNLSGGQKHRLQLAICFAREKPIILLDEPTASLDIESADKILQQLMSINKNTAMLVASHDLNLLHYFDSIIIMGKHTILEQGNIKSLLQDKNSYLCRLIKYHNLI